MNARFWQLLLAFASTFYFSNAWAIFVNGGFETNDFSSWTTTTGYNPGLKLPQPFNEASIVVITGGTQLLSVVGAIQDPRTDNLLVLPGTGSYTAKINDESGGNDMNVISQQAVITNADRGTDGKLHVRFSYAAVLEDPQHEAHEQPYFYVALKDKTAGTVLYSEFTYSNQAGRSFHTSTYNSSIWKWTDWNNIDIVVPESSLGNTLEIYVVAADCSLGGHGGYVYLDGFGSQGTVTTNYTVASISPSSSSAGGAAFTLTVTGTGFLSGDVVQWNGFSRATTYVSATQLTASIPDTDIAAAGTANVTVARGTTSSTPLTFTIGSIAATCTGVTTATVLIPSFDVCLPVVNVTEIFSQGKYAVTLALVANSNPMAFTVKSSVATQASATTPSIYEHRVLTIPALTVQGSTTAYKVIMSVPSFTAAPYTFVLQSIQ